MRGWMDFGPLSFGTKILASCFLHQKFSPKMYNPKVLAVKFVFLKFRLGGVKWADFFAQ